MSQRELEIGFRERLSALQSLDWILIVPNPSYDERTLIFAALQQVLAKLTCQRRHNVLFVSHIGADEMAEKDGRTILAQLFLFEKMLFALPAQAVVIIR